MASWPRRSEQPDRKNTLYEKKFLFEKVKYTKSPPGKKCKYRVSKRIIKEKK